MSLALTDSELRAVTAASRALLTPLDHAHVDGWRAAVNRQLRAVFGADSGGFLLPDTGGVEIYSDEISRRHLEAAPYFAPPPLPDGTPFWERCVSLGPCTVETIYGGPAREFYESAYYHDGCIPMGSGETLTTHLTLRPVRLTPAGLPSLILATTAGLYLWRTAGAPRFGARDIAVLTLLAPAFRAGVEAERRYRAERSSLLRTIDSLGHAVLVCDVRGRTLHETPAMTGLLAADPEQETIRFEMRRAAAAAGAVSVGAGQRLLSIAGSQPTREVRTARARYRVTATLDGEAACGPAALVLVTLASLTPRPLSRSEIRTTFGLTEAEARVALLLAEGRSNAEIASMTGTTASTARRHTERVLQKLGVSSRAAVAHRLAQSM